MQMNYISQNKDIRCHNFKDISVCAATQLFKICIKTDWKGFFLWTRYLHLQQPVCFDKTICLTSSDIIRGTEWMCVLKKKTTRKKLVTNICGSQLVHSRTTACLLWTCGEEEVRTARERGGSVKVFNTSHIISILWAVILPLLKIETQLNTSQHTSHTVCWVA